VKKILITIFAAALINVLFTSECSAGFQVGPLKQQISVAPGSADQTAIVSIVNSSNTKRKYALKVLGAKQSADGAIIYGSGMNIAESWVVAKDKYVELAPGQAKEVVFEINVPNDAKAGSYYLGLTAEQTSLKSEKSIGVGGQIISVLVLQVAGMVQESLIITETTVPRSIVGNKWPFTFSILNNGAASVPVDVNISARNWLGHIVVDQKVISEAMLLPGAARKYGGEIKVKNFNLPGPYEFQYKIKYGLTGQTAVATKTVWYFPPCSIFLILIIIIAIVGVAKNQKKKM